MRKIVLLSLPIVLILLIISFSSVLSAQYLINEGDTTVVNGKTIGIAGVSDNDTIVVDVDGTSKVINLGETKTFDGIDVKAVEIFYYPKEGEISNAILEISETTTTTTTPVICGDDICSGKETCYSCPQDCNNKCAPNKPGYCIDSNSVSRCDLCGCPEGYDTCLDNGCCSKKICSDSDGGLNYYVKGAVSSGSGTICAMGGGGGGGSPISDICSGNILKERYCDENNDSKSLDYTCPYGCGEGACISKKIITLLDASCSDSIITVIIKNDGAVNIEVSDISFYVNNKLITYPGCDKTMISPGEHTVCDSIPGVQGTNELYIPVQGYSNAISASVYCAGEITTTTPILTCRDSDGGISYYERGELHNVCAPDTLCGVWVDTCLDSNILIEYYCDNFNGIRYSCPNGCEEGACIKGKEPYCDAVGSRSEGWYKYGELIKYDACEGCYAVCKAIGSRSEGWYSSCTGELIKWEKCSEHKLNIQITSPRNGQMVSGIVTVVVEASGTNELGQMELTIQREDESIAKVIIFTTCGGGVACPIDGGDCIYTTSCNYDWDTSGYDGEVILTATITDSNNNKASDSVKVTVINYESCSEQCRLNGYRYGSCKVTCDAGEVNIGVDGCSQTCPECPSGAACAPCVATSCCCASKKSCPYECCVNDPGYLDKQCPVVACPVCEAGGECPPCVQPKCIDHRCVWYPQEDFILKFKTGWNMFSFPVDIRSYIAATTPTAVAEVTAGKAISGKVTGVATETIPIPPERQCPSPAHIWHYSNGRYIDIAKDPNSIVNGWGYWVKMDYDCIVRMTGNKITINDFPELDAGWNQIGAPSDSVNFYSVIGNCEISSGPWWYNSALRKYEKVQILKPGEGYFVKVKNRCTLGSEIPPLPPEELGTGSAFRVG